MNFTSTFDVAKIVLAGNTLTASGNFLDSVAATNTLTGDNTNPTAGGTVTINGRIYTFVAALAVADDIFIGADGDTTLANLVAAINHAAGSGTKYGTGTVINADVSSGAVISSAIILSAKTAGTAGNSITTTEDATHLDFTTATLTGGLPAETVTIGDTEYTWKDTLAATPNQIKIGASAAISLDNFKKAINASGTPGSEYSTGTVINPDVTATTNTDTTQLVVAKNYDPLNNDIPTTTTAASAVWTDTTLTGGVGLTAVPVNTWARTIRIAEIGSAGTQTDFVIAAPFVTNVQEYFVAGTQYQFGPQAGVRTYMPGYTPGYIGAIDNDTTFNSDESN